MEMGQTECSETSTCKIQTPGNYPEESIQHSEHGKSMKSRIYLTVIGNCINKYSFGWYCEAFCMLLQQENNTYFQNIYAPSQSVYFFFHLLFLLECNVKR